MTEAIRFWDEPVEVTRPSRPIPAQPGATGLAAGTRPVGVLEVDGRYNCADVYVQAPTEWDPIFARATVLNGGASSVVVDERAIGGIQDRPAGYGQARRGLLFSIRGRAFSKLMIEIFPIGEALPGAIFSARAWGGPVGVHGDRAQRSTVDLYARNDQQFVFSDVVPAGPVVVEAPNPSGGRLAITSISWTQDGAGLVALEDDTGAQIVGGRLGAGGSFTPAPYVQPIYLPRGRGLQATSSAAGTIMNVAGFRE